MKYQRLNANTLYVSAILFFRSTLHRESLPCLPNIDDYSSFILLKRVTAWIKRFIHNCQQSRDDRTKGYLTVKELEAAENYWIAVAQSSSFPKEVMVVKKNVVVKGRLAPLCPFIDSQGLLCVRGRTDHSKIKAISRQPAILPKDHTVTKLIIRSEHLRLLHAGPTLVMASLSRRFHIVGARRAIRSITRKCVTCRKYMQELNSNYSVSYPQIGSSQDLSSNTLE